MFKTKEEAVQKINELAPVVKEATQEYNQAKQEAEYHVQAERNKYVLPLAEKDFKRAEVNLEFARAYDFVAKIEQEEIERKETEVKVEVVNEGGKEKK